MHLGLKNLLLYSTLCSNSLELHFSKSQNVMVNGYYGIETRCNKKTRLFLVAVSTCQKLLVTQIVRMRY